MLQIVKGLPKSLMMVVQTHRTGFESEFLADDIQFQSLFLMIIHSNAFHTLVSPTE